MVECKNTCGQWGLLALRISAGIIFVAAGWMKLNNIEMVGGMFGTLGIPAASLMAWVVALLEFVGGLALIAGVGVQMFAWVLAGIITVALLTAHRSGPLMSAYAPISLLGSLLALGTLGGGKYQLWKKSLCLCDTAKKCECNCSTPTK